MKIDFAVECTKSIKKIINSIQNDMDVTIQRFNMSCTLPGRNEGETAARTHWSKGSALKKNSTELVAWHILSARLTPLKSFANIVVEFFEPNNKRDSDNVLSSIKYIMDGLVNTGIIENDTRKKTAVILLPVKTDCVNPRIEVTIIGEA